MTLPVVIISRTRGRTPTRGKSYARPLSSGMEISNICRGCFCTILAHIVAPAERTVGARTSHNRVGFTLGGSSLNRDPKPVRINFLWDFSVPRTVFTSLVQPAKQPSGGFTQSLKLLLSRALHAVIKAWSREHEVQRKSASGAQSVE